MLAEPGDRGTLTIRDRVAQKLVLEATRGTPGVRHHAAGMDKLTGRELPRARVLVSGKRVRAKVDIAIEWPLVTRDAVLSPKDSSLPAFADFSSPFFWEKADRTRAQHRSVVPA